MMRNVKPSTVALAAGLGLGLLLLAKRSKAAQASSSSSARPSSSTLPSEAPPAPKPPALPSSTAQEGAPLAWDKREHPLAERGLDDEARELQVTELELEGNAPADKDFPPEVKVVLDVDADASNVRPSSSSDPLARGTVGPAAKPQPPKPKPPKPAAAPAAPKPPAPQVMPALARSPEQAARELFARADQLVKAGKGSQLGTKNAPSSFVRAAQQDMGVAADGIYGPATRERGKALIGKTFPIRK